MEIQEDLDFGGVDIIPTDRGNFKIKDVKITTVKDPQGLKLRYSHLTNDDYQNDNIKSVIDGTKTEFSYAGLDALLQNIDTEMNPDGFQSGMPIDRVFIRKLGASGDSYDAQFSLNGTPSFRNTTLRIFNVYINNTAHSFALTASGTNEFKQVLTKVIPFSQTQNDSSLFDNGDIQSIFLLDAQTAGVRYFDVNVGFTVTGTNDNSNSDEIELSLFRYRNGTDLQFVQKIDVKTWSNASDFVNKTINFQGIIAANLDLGDSLALAIGYKHPPQSFVERYADFRVNNATIKAIKAGETGGGSNTYLATIDFMMPMFFDLPSDLENRTIPKPLFDSGSLTDNFELEIFPEWNNPNTSITNNTDHTERLGNTGWFDENFNGLDNDFKIESVKYRNENGDVLQQLDYNSPVFVEAVVSGIKNLDGDSEFGFGFAWIPQDEDDFKEKNTPYHKNLFVSTGRKYSDGVNDSFNLGENTVSNIFEGNSNSSARMDVTTENGVFFVPSGNDSVKFIAKFIPTPEFSEEFNNKNENDRNYVLWVSVADSDLRINFSNRVSLLLDYKNMVKFIPPAGPYAGMTNKFLEHPEQENVAGVDKYFGFLEDDILNRVEFRINPNDDKTVSSLVYGFEVENKDTGATYELESYPLNLSTFAKDVDGVQNFNIDESRGFKLENGNNKNWVKLNRNPLNDNGDNKAYLGYFGTKIRWEDWIKRENVPKEFFNINLENDGYNNSWLDYLRADTLGNYKINFFVNLQLIEDGEFKSHKNTWEISFAGYDENLNIETTHKYHRDSDNTLLNIGIDPDTGKPLGVLLNNEPTRIEITYENLIEDMSIADLYAVTTIEIDKGAGEFEFRQLSSVWGSEADNILVPLQSETKLKLEQITARIVKASCLVDNNQLADALRYKVSGRLGCFSDGNGNANAGKYEARYENKYE